jgi:Major Facilitator Superfamily
MSATSTVNEPIQGIERSNYPIQETKDNVKEPESSSKQRLELTDQTNLLPLRMVLTIFAGLSLCILISALDSVIVATALPTISAFFQAGSTSAWVPSAYLLTSTGFQPLYGRFSDIFGRKVTMCVATGLYMIGSLAAGFGRSIDEVIVFRGTQ